MAKKLEELKKYFPADVTKSMVADIYNECKGNKEEVIKIGRGMSEVQTQEEEKRQKLKVQELKQNFPGLSDEQIIKALQENEWDDIKAIEPLFKLMGQHKEKERVAARKVAEKEAAKSFLNAMFSNIPDVKIQDILDENEGDVDATAEALIRYVDEQKKQNKPKEDTEAIKAQEEQERKKMEKQAKIESLYQHFSEHYITEEDVVTHLEKNNWDSSATTAVLLKISEDRKVDHLLRLYRPLTIDQVRQALIDNSWDPIKAVRSLATLKLENTEEKRQDTEEKRPDTQEVKHIDTPFPSIEPVVRLDTTAENNTFTNPFLPPSQPNPPSVRGPADPSFLNRSVQIDREIKKMVDEKMNQDPKAMVKQQIDRMVRGGEMPGLPGALENGMPREEHPQKPPVSVSQAITEIQTPDKSDSPVNSSLSLAPTPNPGEVLPVKITTSKDRYEVGEEITAGWSGAESTAQDWIGLYRVGAKHNQYVTYNWVGKAGERSGTLAFTAPDDFRQYEFRYFSDRSYTLKGMSVMISIGPLVELVGKYHKDEGTGSGKLEVTINQKAGKVYPNAWIGLYASEEVDGRSYRAFDWIASCVDHKLSFPAFKTGKWEFRFFPSKSNYVDVARCVVDVTGNDCIVLSTGNGEVIAQCDVASADPSTDCVWIGLYFVDQQDNTQWRRYKAMYTRSATVTFKAPKTPGTYEARLFAHKKYEPIAKSQNSITIK